MSLYNCTSCTQSISAFNPRVRCFTCDKIVDLCANCQLGERFVAPHTGEHQVYILKISGSKERPSHPGVVPASVLGSMPKNVLTEPPPVPVRPTAAASFPSSFTPPLGPPNLATRRTIPAMGPPPSSVLPNNGPWLSTPHRSPSDPTLWKPFFNEQGFASPAFIELLSAIFNRLDPNNTVALTPEAFSEFLSAMGQTGEANLWQHEFDKHGGIRKDFADQALRNYYNFLSIDHRMRRRPALDCHVGITCDGCDAQNFTGGRYKCTHEQCPDYDLCETCRSKGTHPADHQFLLVDPPQGSEAPLLTLSGFIDLETLSMLESHSPNVMCRPMLNAMLRHFNLFPERGPIPETGGILPDYPSANVLERIRKANEANEKIQDIRLQTEMSRVNAQMDASRFMTWSALVNSQRY